jgi:hypothetical protein
LFNQAGEYAWTQALPRVIQGISTSDDAQRAFKLQAAAITCELVSVAGAIFLILELDEPFGGLIRISSRPMLNALNHLAK